MKKVLITYKVLAIALMSLFLLGNPVQKATFAQNLPELEQVLEKLNEEYLTVTNAIPNRLDFSGGESGYYITYGNGMFWDGNYISTDIGGAVQYSNNNISTSNYFGGQGKYFTRKYPGLFVLTANLDGVNEFMVYGEYNFYNPTLDGTELTSGGFKGFVKRATSGYSYDPTVNHLIIVKDDPQVGHTYSNSGDNYSHTISGLGNTSRIYYLLYAGSNDYYIDDEETQEIMDAFVNILIFDTIPPNPPTNLIVEDVLNTSARATWTAPSDDTVSEPVSAYDIRLDTNPITAINFEDAPVYENSLTPGTPGTTESLLLEGLMAETRYYIGLRALDEANAPSSAIFSTFVTGADPEIVVSTTAIEVSLNTGNAIQEFLTISNPAEGTSPLNFNIESDIAPMNDVYTWAVDNNGYNIYRVNLLNNTSESFQSASSISGIATAMKTGELWLTSHSSNKVTVVSSVDFSTQTSIAAANVRKVCIPRLSDKAFVMKSSDPVNIDVYNIYSYELEYSLSLDTYNSPSEILVSEDGTKICILEQYDYFRVYNAQNGSLINNYSIGSGYNRMVLSPNSDFAYCASWGGYILSINLQNYETQQVDIGNQIEKIAINPEGSTLFINQYGSSDKVLALEASTLNALYTLNLTSGYGLVDMKVSANDRFLYTLTQYDERMTTYDLTTKQVHAQKYLPGQCKSLSFMGGYTGYVNIEPLSGTITSTNAQIITISIDGTLLAPGNYNSTLHISSNDPDNLLINVPLKVRVEDVSGPDFTMSFFQNHYLTSNLKVIIFAHEMLDSIPDLSTGGENLEVEKLDSLNFMYNSSYTLTTTEDITFAVTGTDSLGNTSTFERTLSSTQVFKNTPVVAAYPGDRVKLCIADDSFFNDLFVTIWEEETPEAICYHVGPESMCLNANAKLAISWAGTAFANMNPQHIAIYRKDIQSGNWELMPGVYNSREQCVKAEIDQLGVFKLGFDDAVYQAEEEILTDSGSELNITPNPFKNEAVIQFENPLQGHVEIAVYDLTGNKVYQLHNPAMPEGLNTLTIDGESLKPGIYICRVNTPGGEYVKRIVRIK